MARLMTEVHHDLALILDVVDSLLKRRQLGVGEVEGDADDRLPVGAGPFVAEVAGRVEAAEPLRRQLAVELGDVLLEHRPLELQAEVLDLHLEEASRLRRRLLERVHGGHGTGFEHVVAPAAPCVRTVIGSPEETELERSSLTGTEEERLRVFRRVRNQIPQRLWLTMLAAKIPMKLPKATRRRARP